MTANPAKNLRDARKRLDAAFATLSNEGIFARQNFECCQTCGVAAVPENTQYVFYHAQDNDDLVKTGTFHLTFGGPIPTVTALRAVAALADAGLEAEWDGDVRRRIAVVAFVRPERKKKNGLPELHPPCVVVERVGEKVSPRMRR